MCACFSLKTKTPGLSWLNDMKFAVLCSDIEIHGRIEFVFAVFILYESLYHGWRSG